MFFSTFRGKPARTLQLQNKRIYLRPPVQSDWREWSALRAASRDFLAPWEPIWPYDALTRGAFRRRLKIYKTEARQGIGHSLLAFRKTDNELLGGVTLSNLRRGVAQAGSLGYWIGERYSRQGYMTESLAAVLNFGFVSLGLHRIEAACLADNTASRNLLLKCGFHEEGIAREYLRINGHWQDHQLFAVLRRNCPAVTDVKEE